MGNSYYLQRIYLICFGDQSERSFFIQLTHPHQETHFSVQVRHRSCSFYSSLWICSCVLGLYQRLRSSHRGNCSWLLVVVLQLCSSSSYINHLSCSYSLCRCLQPKNAACPYQEYTAQNISKVASHFHFGRTWAFRFYYRVVLRGGSIGELDSSYCPSWSLVMCRHCLGLGSNGYPCVMFD